MSRLKLIFASGASFLGGIAYHRHAQTRSNKFAPPGLPIFGTVSAATAAVLSPAITEPAVPFVPSPKADLVPAEPQKGFSRVAEIMRFGFPGFDNVRSRR